MSKAVQNLPGSLKGNGPLLKLEILGQSGGKKPWSSSWSSCASKVNTGYILMKKISHSWNRVFICPLCSDEMRLTILQWTANQQIHNEVKSFFFRSYLTAEINRPNSTQMRNQLRLWGRSASNLPIVAKLIQAFSNLGEEKCFLLGSLLQSVVKLENQMLRVYVLTHLSITHSSLPCGLLLPPLCSDGASRCNEFISANSAHRCPKSPFAEVLTMLQGEGPAVTASNCQGH